MFSFPFSILFDIEKCGYKAYLVGGYVRNILLHVDSTDDIDIATNAPIDVLVELFQHYEYKVGKYNTISLSVNNFNVDIAHFRYERLIDEKLKVELVDDILLDVERRDFTINSIYMDKDKKIYYFNSAKKDIKKRKIKFIGLIKNRMQEDITRALRYIDFISRFKLCFDKDEMLYIKSQSHNICESISSSIIHKYIEKMFSYTDIQNTIKTLKISGLYEELFEDSQAIRYKSIYGFFSQINYKYFELFSKDFKRHVNSIRTILLSKDISHLICVTYDLIDVYEASYILGIPRRKVSKIYNELVIKNISEVVVNKKQISTIMKCDIDENVQSIYNNIIELIITGKLKNDCDVIKEYILKGVVNNDF